MSIHRFAAKRDESEKGIVDALVKAGYQIIRFPHPDLGARKGWYPKGCHLLLECKTPTKTGRLPRDKRQVEQNEFCDAGGAIRVGTPEAALAAMFAFELWITP